MLSSSTSFDGSSPTQDVTTLLADITKYKQDIIDSRQKLVAMEEQYDKRVSELQHAQKTIQLLNERFTKSNRTFDDNLQAMRDDLQELQAIDKEMNNISYLSTSYLDDSTEVGVGKDTLKRQSQQTEREIRRLRALVRFYRNDQRIMSQSRAEADLRIQALEVENTAVRKEIASLRSQLELSNTRVEFLEEEYHSISDQDNLKKATVSNRYGKSKDYKSGNSTTESPFSGNVTFIL